MVRDTLEKSWRPIFLISIVFGLLVGVLDGVGYQMFQQTQNPGQVYQAVVGTYMPFFHGLVFAGVLGMTAIVYYYRRNLRDAASFFIFTAAVIFSGLWDLLYYQLPYTPSMPAELSHLSDTPVGTAAQLFNSGVVTPEMVLLNVPLILVPGLLLAGFIRFGDFDDII